MAIFLALISGKAYADEIVFKNGERLIGTFERMEGGKLIFKSQTIGEVTIDISQVKLINAEKLFNIHFQDGNILKSKIFKSEEDLFTVDGTDAAKGQTFEVSAVSAINPPVKPKVTWDGSIAAGYTSTHGNTFTEQANVALGVVIRSERTRLRLDSLYVLGRDEDDDTGDKKTHEENFSIGAKYDYFFTKKVFGYVSGSFKKDHIADLDYRTITGAGGGYQWIETGAMKFSTDAGLALLKEKYTNKVSKKVDDGEDSEDSFILVKEVTRSNKTSLQFGYNFDWKPYEKINFLSNMTYTPSVDDFSDYYLKFDAELRLAITNSIYNSFKFILDYDSEPGEDSSTTDTKYILGVGWDFF
jgi:putative salt-induced outer membrane protein YdiY